MTARFRTAAAAAAVLLAPGAAAAADIANRDDVAYELIVTEDGRETRTRIAPGETLEDLCRACRVRVGDIGTLRLQADDVVVLRDGHVTGGARGRLDE